MSESVAEVRVNAAPLIGGHVTQPLPSPGGHRRRELTGIVGQPLEIRCGVRATQSVVWTKDGGTPPRSALIFGPILTILSVQLSDAGQYMCASHDMQEEIDLSVEGKSRIY